MSKAGSPFLKSWIGQYKAVKVKENWEELSIKTPCFMLQDRHPDQPVLDGHSWIYKLSTKQTGEATIRMHWVSKSWHDIDRSFGTRFWRPNERFAYLVTPKTIREVDTPLVCHVRKPFDNMDNDGYHHSCAADVCHNDVLTGKCSLKLPLTSSMMPIICFNS